MINFLYERLYPNVTAPTKTDDCNFCYDIRAYFNPQQRLDVLYQASTDTTINGQIAPLREANSEEFYIEIPVGYRVLIPTGIKGQVTPSQTYIACKTNLEDESLSYLPVTFGSKLHIRSGVSYKRGLVLVNSVGIVDSNFPEEWKLIMTNISSTPIKVYQGEKIAQVEFGFSLNVNFVEQTVIEKDRKSGLGSTGT